jgi:glutamate dehydrogenase/leucine dehydrogenase
MPDVSSVPLVGEHLDHEELHAFFDPKTGLRAVVAIHSTRLGPAAGGLRLHAYRTLEGAIADALRLSRAMTFKNAAADLDLGGGKAVLIDDGGWERRQERMQAFGALLERLGGRYITAEDVGTTPEDMETIARVTDHVAGRLSGRGDPSAATARTVFAAIRDAASIALGRELAELTVGVLGVGQVGAKLVGLLRGAGARVAHADLDASRAERVAAATGSELAPVDGFVARAMDVFAPCALGATIRADQLSHLRCAVVCGAANNPLCGDATDVALARAGITYVPDFLANCGGIIHIAAEICGFDDEEVDSRIDAAINRTRSVLEQAHATAVSPAWIANQLVARRLARGQRRVALPSTT